MAATVHRLALSEPPVDINEATAEELSELLPGVGSVLARRIVAYREEHGPFAHPSDLVHVPGISEKRVSKMAPRLSIVPTSGMRLPAVKAAEPPSPEGEYIRPIPIFGITGDTWREPNVPSLESLLPNLPPEDHSRAFSDAPLGGFGPSEAPFSFSPPFSALPEAANESTPTLSAPAVVPSEFARSFEIGNLDDVPILASARSPRHLEEVKPEAETEEYLRIPIRRPWKVWLVLGAIGMFSATLGATFAIRSQAGARGSLENRVGRAQSDVADLAGAVNTLGHQSSTWASAINALDERVSKQERDVAVLAQKASPAVNTQPRPPRSPREAAVRERVHQALADFDTLTPAAR